MVTCVVTGLLVKLRNPGAIIVVQLQRDGVHARGGCALAEISLDRAGRSQGVVGKARAVTAAVVDEHVDMAAVVRTLAGTGRLDGVVGVEVDHDLAGQRQVDAQVVGR